MGNGNSQCKPGIFGTGQGVQVNYGGISQNLGGSSICTRILSECIDECNALGCGDSATCCKMCEAACCQPGPAQNPNSPICKQIKSNSPPLPNDYCTNPQSKQEYDKECPHGCLDDEKLSVQQLPVGSYNLTPLKILIERFLLLIIVLFIATVLILYYVFIHFGMKKGKAIALAIISPIVLSFLLSKV